MPVEVRELVIKATVSPETAQGNAAPVAGSNNSVSASEEIIKTCVERVLEILKEEKER